MPDREDDVYKEVQNACRLRPRYGRLGVSRVKARVTRITRKCNKNKICYQTIPIARKVEGEQGWLLSLMLLLMYLRGFVQLTFLAPVTMNGNG